MINVEKMIRSLSALQLEVSPSVAADVRQKVLAVYVEQDLLICKLRDAISQLKPHFHGGGCSFITNYAECNCEADSRNAALTRARKIAGLNEERPTP